MSPEAGQLPVRIGASRLYRLCKAAADPVLALAALIVLSPFLLWLALRVRMDSPGPALFRQTRAGRGGRPFNLLKFRTMRTDADPFGDSPQSGDDPRVTRVGKWLRERSLDELPQLINVLRGEMALVGPRPLYVQQIAEWSPRHRARLLVKPGLTGLAQVNGRGSLTIEEKLEWDVQYVEQFGLWMDLRIIVATLRNVRTREGIYEVRYSRDRERRGEADDPPSPAA